MKTQYKTWGVFLSVLFVLGLSHAQTTIYRVAVLDFVVNDLSGDTRTSLYEQAFPNYFPAPIQNSQKFELVNRSILVNLIDEISLSEEGLTDENIKRFGELYSVDIFISGTITIESQGENPILIIASFTDTSTGKVQAITDIRIKNESEFQRAAQELISKALPRFPLRGSIYEIVNSDVYINLGSIHGLTPKDTSGLIFREKAIGEKTIDEQIGSFRILNINRDISEIAVEMLDGSELQLGDIITVEPLGVSNQGTVSTEPLPSTDSSSPSSINDLPTNSAQGFLFLTGSPEGATVYFDDQIIGTLNNSPLQVEVSAISAELRVEAEGFETLSKDLTVSANAVLNESVSLIRAKGSLTVISDNGAQVDVSLINQEGIEVATGTIPKTFEDLETGVYTLQLSSAAFEMEDFQAMVVAGSTPSVARLSLTEKELVTTVLINTLAEATILLDGQIQTSTLLNLEPLKNYILEVRADGYESYFETLNLTAGEQVTLTANLTEIPQISMAQLGFSVTPIDAVIKLNDKIVDTSDIITLEAGIEHVIEVSANGYETQTKPLILEPDALVTETINLNEKTIQLTINTTPQEAIIRINNQSLQGNSFEGSSGNYELSIEAQGYETFNQSLTLINNETLDITLEPRLNTLTFEVTPDDAVVAIDGVEQVGRSFNLLTGSYVIRVEAEAYASETLKLDLYEDQIIPLNLVSLLATIDFQITPSNALITVNGEEINSQSVQVTPNEELVILVSAPGFKEESRNLVLAASEQYSFQLDLNPQPQAESTVQESASVEASASPSEPTSEASTTTGEASNQSSETIETPNEPLSALAENQGRLEIETNVETVRIVFETSDQNLDYQLTKPLSTIDLPDGIYSYTASAAGTKPIEDIVFVSRGQTEKLSLMFEKLDLLLSLGTYNNDGKLEFLLLADMNAQDQDYQLNLSDSALVQGKSPYYKSLSKGKSYLRLEGFTAQTASYPVSLFANSLGVINLELNLTQLSQLDPARSIVASTTNLNNVSVSWQPPTEALSSEVQILRGNDLLVSEETTDTSLNINNLNLNSGEEYLACIQVQNWDFGSENPLPAQPLAARTCSVFETPNTGSNSGGNNNSNPSPQPDNPVTPPNDNEEPCLIPGRC